MRANRDLTNVAGIRGKSQMGCERAFPPCALDCGVAASDATDQSDQSDQSDRTRRPRYGAVPRARHQVRFRAGQVDRGAGTRCEVRNIKTGASGSCAHGARRTGPRYPQWPHQVALGEECPVDPRNLTNDANSPGSPTLTRSALLQPWTGLGIAGGEETGVFCF